MMLVFFRQPRQLGSMVLSFSARVRHSVHSGTTAHGAMIGFSLLPHTAQVLMHWPHQSRLIGMPPLILISSMMVSDARPFFTIFVSHWYTVHPKRSAASSFIMSSV